MPRLPTMRVIGSHAIETSLRRSVPTGSRVMLIADLLLTRPARLVAGGQLRTIVVPLGFAVDGAVGDAAERADQRPVGAYERSRDTASGRLVHERHELV